MVPLAEISRVHSAALEAGVYLLLLHIPQWADYGDRYFNDYGKKFWYLVEVMISFLTQYTTTNS